MKQLRRLGFTIVLGLLLTASGQVSAQNPVAPDKPAKPAAALYDKSSTGVGPIRSEDWFVKAWRERRAKFDELKAQQQHAIVFFGDSITQGWSDDFRGKFKGLNVANRGISGDTTRGLLARLDADVLSLNPSGIVLLIGTNDIGLKIPPEGIADNVKLLIGKITAHDPKIPIILCQVMSTSDEKWHRPTDQIRKLNQLLADVARGNEQVTLLDTYAVFANAQ